MYGVTSISEGGERHSDSSPIRKQNVAPLAARRHRHAGNSRDVTDDGRPRQRLRRTRASRHSFGLDARWRRHGAHAVHHGRSDEAERLR